MTIQQKLEIAKQLNLAIDIRTLSGSLFASRVIRYLFPDLDWVSVSTVTRPTDTHGLEISGIKGIESPYFLVLDTRLGKLVIETFAVAK